MKKVDLLCKVKGCGGVFDIGIKYIGFVVYLKWVRLLLNGKLYLKVYIILLKIKVYYFLLFQICLNFYVAEIWCFQLVLNRGLYGGDLFIFFVILFFGNDFNKIELFVKIFYMGFLSQFFFIKFQRKYLVFVVDDFWEEKQEEMIVEMVDKDFVFFGICIYINFCFDNVCGLMYC